MSPRKRVAQLYPKALGSLYVASYDSQGYGGGILTKHLPSYSEKQAVSNNMFPPTCGLDLQATASSKTLTI
jgi:hypothetical protein